MLINGCFMGNIMELSDVMADQTLTPEQRRSIASLVRRATARGIVATMERTIKDLCNKIAGPKGFVQMAEEIGLEGPIKDYLDYIKQGVIEAGEVLNGKYRRILYAGATTPTYQELAQVVGEAMKAVRHQKAQLLAEKQGVKIAEMQGSNGQLYTSVGNIELLLGELVENGMEAMPKDGAVTVTVGKRNLDDNYVRQRPDVRAGEYCFLQVKDSGTGMDEETKQRIFEPGFTTRGDTKGKGFGLTVVDIVVTRCNGHIDVESAPNRGTIVTIYFPAYTQAPASTSPDPNK